MTTEALHGGPASVVADLANAASAATSAATSAAANAAASAATSAATSAVIRAAIAEAGGWLPFDRFMALALYAPGVGYYAGEAPKFGLGPESGSDFVTAPELSPTFGAALARAVAQALDASATDEVWEFGAGSGALAAQLLTALDRSGAAPRCYTIVELSSSLRERQQARLAAFGTRVRWVDALPDAMQGVVVGNEVLDAMPVTLLHWTGAAWLQRGVVAEGAGFAWSDRLTSLRPPFDGPFVAGSVVEIHPQAEAFVASLADRLVRGAAYFIDYGFPQAEYYHPQRTGGTLMCHRAHQADADPLVDVGAKDITAHVDFTGIALAGQDAGLDVLGYTTQAHFLIDCGLLDLLQDADIRTVAHAQKLLTEHEMGELFKVIGFARGCDAAFMCAPIGFRHGDRVHTL